MSGSCESDINLSGSRKYGKFLGFIRDYYLLKDGSAPWSLCNMMAGVKLLLHSQFFPFLFGGRFRTENDFLFKCDEDELKLFSFSFLRLQRPVSHSISLSPFHSSPFYTTDREITFSNLHKTSNPTSFNRLFLCFCLFFFFFFLIFFFFFFFFFFFLETW